MTPTEFKKDIDSLCGAYLFYGEEEYLKHYYLEEVRKAVVPDASFDVFNRVILSGAEGLASLEGAIAMPPMMAEKKLIEVHAVRYSALKAEELDELCTLLQRAAEDGGNVVILYAQMAEAEVTNPKKPPAFFKELSAHATPVEFARQSPGKLVSWIGRHFAHEGIKAGNEECLALIDYCTRDMSALANEITKLCAYLKAHGRVTLDKKDIPYICCHIDEIAAFDFANAILNGERGRAYAILKDMAAKKQKPPQILGSIAAVYGDLYRIQSMRDAGMSAEDIGKSLRMNEYKVKLYLRALGKRSARSVAAALAACAEADLKLKSTNLPAFGVLSSLVIAP